MYCNCQVPANGLNRMQSINISDLVVTLFFFFFSSCRKKCEIPTSKPQLKIVVREEEEGNTYSDCECTAHLSQTIHID